MAAREARGQAIRQLVARRLAPEQTDRELLDRFSGRADESAFEALVRRHAGLVLATARRVLGNAHDAEDVCQAAFLLLARKAASRRWQPSVASWLHRTAHHLALKIRTAAARRARREERSAARPPADPLDELTGRELLAVLDQELLGLPESLRAPLVLCYLQGVTRDEAAARLGCSLSTLKVRLERGRARLRAALVRRGLGLSSGLLPALVSRDASAAVPAALVRRIASHAVGGPGDGGIPPRVDQLIHGGMGMVVWKKIKAGLGLVLVGGLLSAAALSAGTDKPAPQPKDEAAAGAKATPPAARPEGRSMRVSVLDPDGKPVSGARIRLLGYEPGFKDTTDRMTDDAGVVRVEIPENLASFGLRAEKSPFVALKAYWQETDLVSTDIPADFTFRFQPGVSAGGRVVDEDGKPIAGARLRLSLDGARAPKPARNHALTYFDLSSEVTTDADGRWRVESVPDHPGMGLRPYVIHPDFVSGSQPPVVREGTVTTTLRRGVIVRGRVTAPDGSPVKNAAVTADDEPAGVLRQEGDCKTDADGRYQLPAQPSAKASLMVVATGWAPQVRKVEIRPGLPAQDFRLEAGKPIRLRVVDATGKPVPGATVFVSGWRGSSRVYLYQREPENGFVHRTGADGVWNWPSAPDDPVRVRIVTEGHIPLELTLEGGQPERTVTLQPAGRVTGMVTDAVTGRPIPRFAVHLVTRFGSRLLCQRGTSGPYAGSGAGRNGRFEYFTALTECPLRLRVEAPGYRTQDGPEFRAGQGAAHVHNFRLQSSPPLTGVVLDVDGRPAARTEVQLATPSEPAQDGRGAFKTYTDDSGRFTFPNPGEAGSLVVQTDVGIAIVDVPVDRLDVGTLKLQSWGTIRGQFRDGGKPVAGAEIRLAPVRVLAVGWPLLTIGACDRTDAEGRFEFRRVPPGPVSVHAYPGWWKEVSYRSAPSVPLDVAPDGRADLNLGSGGATLTGRVKLTGPVPAGLNCADSFGCLVRREPGVAPPPTLAPLGFDIRKGFQNTWLRAPEGLAYLSTLRHWFVKLAPDGSFRVDGVPPGEYDLAVSVYDKPSSCLFDPLARRVVRVTVTAADAARGDLAVPEIAAAVVPIPAVGDTPTLTFDRADGTRGSLTDVRGKYTVVHFWASWCLAYKTQLPVVRMIHDRFAPRGLTILGLSQDDDPAAWAAAVAGMDVPWPQRRARADSARRMSGWPTYWLLDPAGKIVATTSDVDELAAAIERRLKDRPGGR